MTQTLTAQRSQTMAPLRIVDTVSVSDKSGKELNPMYFWLTWEYTLTLECGHTQVRARCAYDWKMQPEDLKPPLPKRVRCTECPATLATRIPRQTVKPNPTFDPVVGALVAAMCKADLDSQDDLLAWIEQHGRFCPNTATRDRAYGAMALAAVAIYLPDTTNPRAQDVVTALQAWVLDPTGDNRQQVSKAARRLYHSQDRSGSWCAHRGIIAAAKIVSPYPHNVWGVVDCPTWDQATRNAFYGQLWELRGQHDQAKEDQLAAFLDDDGAATAGHHKTLDALTQDADRVFHNNYPQLSSQHMKMAWALLDAFQQQMQGPPDPKHEAPTD